LELLEQVAGEHHHAQAARARRLRHPSQGRRLIKGLAPEQRDPFCAAVGGLRDSAKQLVYARRNAATGIVHLGVAAPRAAQPASLHPKGHPQPWSLALSLVNDLGHLHHRLN
jgi:hypothetical protein